MCGSEASDCDARLLSTVLTAFSQLTTTKLSDIMPLTSSVDVSSRPAAVKSRDRSSANATVSMVDDNRMASYVLGGEAANFPMLVGHMLHQTEMELVGRAHSWTFRDVLDRLLVIAGNPIRHALGQVLVVLSCMLLSVCWTAVQFVECSV